MFCFSSVSADLNNRHPLVAFFCEHVAKPWPEWGQESTNAECRNFQLSPVSASALMVISTWPSMLQTKKGLEFLMNFPG